MSVPSMRAGLGSRLMGENRGGDGEATTRGSREGVDGRKRGRPKGFDGNSIHRGDRQGSLELTWEGVVADGYRRNRKETLYAPGYQGMANNKEDNDRDGMEGSKTVLKLGPR